MKKSIPLLLAIAIIFISFAAVFVKWSEAPATVISMYRMYLSSLFLLPFVYVYRKDLAKISGKKWILLIIAGMFLALHFALWFESLKLTSVANSTIILTLQPIVALIGGYFIFKERTNSATLLTLAIAIIGIVMVSWDDFNLQQPSALLGNFLSFLSVLAVVGYLFIGQSNVRGISHWVYSFIVFFVAGATLHLFNLLQNIPVLGYDSTEWGIFFLLAIFPTVAHVIFNYLLNFVNSSTISMSILGEPVGATFLAFFILNETITLLQLIGGLIVLFEVFLFLMQQRKSLST